MEDKERKCLETKATIPRKKNLVCGNNRWLDTEEETIIELEDRETESIQTEIYREKSLKKKQQQITEQQWLWDNIKQFTIQIIRISEEEERKEVNNNLFE